MEAFGMSGVLSGRVPVMQGFGGLTLILNPTNSRLCRISGGARSSLPELFKGLAGGQLGELAGRHRPWGQSNRLSRPQIGEIARACGLGFRSERRQRGGG